MDIDDKCLFKNKHHDNVIKWFLSIVDRLLRIFIMYINNSKQFNKGKKYVMNIKWVREKKANTKTNKDYYEYLEKNINKYGFDNEEEFEEAMLRARDDCIESGGRLSYSSKNWQHRSMLDKYQKKWFTYRNDGGIDPIRNLNECSL